MAELADAQDSGSCEVHSSCGFKSHLRHTKGDSVIIPIMLLCATAAFEQRLF